MRYLCLNCEERFEHEEGQGKLRCPKCLRVTGLEKLDKGPASSAKAPSGSSRVPIAIAVALAAIIGGYAIWHAQAPEQVGETIPDRPLSESTLAAHVRRLRANAGELVHLLDANETIEGFATRATGGRRGAFEAAEGVQAALREKASARSFVRWSLGVPRDGAPSTAAQAYERMSEPGAAARLYPLEVSAIMTAALRSRGVNAMIAEIYRFSGDDAPPDPSGQIGYYGVAVYEGEAGEGTPRIFDPWGGHERAPEEADVRVLNDVEAVGAALNIRALYLLVRENDPERALAASADAARLCPRSPAVRAVRGAIVLVAGNPTEALSELEAAQQLRADGPRRNLVAGIYMAREDLESAEREASAALEEFPGFANAHATLAAIHMAQGDPDLARTELAAAERADPDLYILPSLRAGLFAASGDLDHAVAEIRHAVEVNPDFNTRLAAAQIYRQAGRYDDMRREAAALLALTPEARRAQLREALVRRLGASAFDTSDEEPLTDEDLAAVDEEQGGSESLTLRPPTLGLPSAPPASDALDDEALDDAHDDAHEGPSGEDGPALLLGDRNRFNLGGGSLTLH